MLIQPSDSLFMLITSPFDNPDYNFSVFPCRIHNDFSQMIMVGIFQLILDDNPTGTPAFAGVDVYTETSYWRFRFLKLQVNFNGITQLFQIFFLGKPF